MSEFVLKAGELDRRLTIMKAGTVEDEYGDQQPGFTDGPEVWAKQRPAPGGERFASGETAATAPMVFWIRWSAEVADVNPKDRVRCDGQVYDVKSAIQLGRRVAIEILGVREAD